MPTKRISPVHFEDYSAQEIERLVFAFHMRTGKWKSIDWYGQVGSDLGRDILGVRDDDSSAGEVICIQCANWRNLSLKKATRDIDKAVASPTRPAVIRFVTGGNVSAKTRDKIQAHAKAARVRCEIWSASEFEERLRHRAESLFKRFVDGETFPDASCELEGFVASTDPSDAETIRLLTSVFDRPAFYTPFQHESFVPAFRQALDDTICALGTGIRKTRDGRALAPIPSRHAIRDDATRDAFAKIERGVAGLRARFDQLVRSGDIRPCAESCGDPKCSVYVMSDAAIGDMDEIRSKLLEELRRVDPSFTLRVDWT